MKLISVFKFSSFLFALAGYHMAVFAASSTTFTVPGTDESANLSDEANLVQTFYTILTTWIAPLVAACMIFTGIIRCSKKHMTDGLFLIVCGVLLIFIKPVLAQLSTLISG